MTAIRRIQVFAYELRYAHGTYAMSDRRLIDTLQSTVVRVTTESGIHGYGEVCPLGPTYLPSFARGAQAALLEIAPSLIGVDASNLAAVTDAMDHALAGHGYAKSALDVACWDLLGRESGLSVSTLLGGRRLDQFPLYVAVPLRPADEMAGFVRARRAEGIHQFQLKLGGDPRTDAERTEAVASELGDEDVIIADANCGWRLQEATLAVRLLERFDNLFLEQPCRTFEECLIIRDRTTLPMILDEVIHDVSSCLRAFHARAMEAFNLKISKVGGLSKAKLLRDLAEELGLGITIEDTWGGDLTTAAVAHLAATTRSRNLFTVSFMNDWTLEHIANHQPRSHQGSGSAPTGPGLGIEVDLERMGEPLFSVGRT